MKMGSLVSIIIPVYNVEKYVKACLDSVLAQSYKNVEIVVVNDGSTDNSLLRCQEYSDPRIILITKTNGGLSDARNTGVKAAKGKYILFVDSDDIVHPDIVIELINNMYEYECDISGCDKTEFLDGTEPIWQNENCKNVVWDSSEMMCNLVGSYADQLTMAPYKLYKKEVIEKHPFPVGKIHEDEFTAYKILHSSMSFVYSEKKLYGYRIRNNSIMSTFNLRAEKDSIEAKKKIFEFYNLNVDNDRAKSRAFFLLLRNIELSYYKIICSQIKSDYTSELEKEFKELYKSNKTFRSKLNLYESFILKLFYYSKSLFIMSEKIKRKILHENKCAKK